MKKIIAALAVVILAACSSDEKTKAPQQVVHNGNNFCVKMTTSAGEIDLLLNAEKAPVSAQNFLDYVNAGFYQGTVFHRVIENFMIQAGGHTADMAEKETREPIVNEADNGLSNVRGSLAMARTPEPHSASAQFYINHRDNARLDHTEKTPQGWGYAVFGEVVAGMDVVDRIAAVQTGKVNGMSNVPLEAIVIESMVLAECPAAAEE